MNTERLAMLAQRYAPSRSIIGFIADPNATTFALACGHIGKMPPHFDPNTVKAWNCRHCGETIARQRHGAEF